MASGSRPRRSVCTSEADRNVKRKSCAIDFDTLDCPICLEMLTAPIYQCNNGHAACASCCKKLTKRVCPSCLLPIDIRCIALEKIIESVLIQCKYGGYGCEKMLPYTKRKRDEHEGVCKFRPYQCPVVGCNHDVPGSGLPDHFLTKHDGEIVYYEKPDEEDYDDEMRNSFIISTDDVAYDRLHNQYVIVQVSGDSEDSEDQDSEEQDSDKLFLVHHQFHERYCRYSFSLTSFGPCASAYRLVVSFEREGPRPGRSKRTVKCTHSIEGPVHDNQRERALLNKVVRQGDCLFVPKLSASLKDTSRFEVQFQIFNL